MQTFWAAFLAFIVANVALLFIGILFLVGIIAASSSGGAEVKDKSILKIDFSTPITDQGGGAPMDLDLKFMKLSQQNALVDVLNAINAAAKDDRIEGIYLDIPMGLSLSITNIEELRAALIAFKKSGKFIVSYAEAYPQSGYYLASVADSILVNPEGGVAWHGMAANIMFMKGLLDKAEVEAQIIRHGDFKSAVEPFMYTKMSDENRLQYKVLLESIWGTVVSQVSEARGIDSQALEGYAETLAVENAQVALESGMVTGLKYQDQVVDILSGLTGVEGEDEPEMVSLSDYMSDFKSGNVSLSKNKVAVVYAEGTIVSGSSDQENVGSDALTEQLIKLRKDDDVKAVVLRVNSPGGSSLASEVMWREIELLRAKKPVVVSMGEYAASGGYYIACPADVILANKTTLTGSIGVFGLVFNAQKAFNNKLGITFDGVKTNASADMGSLYRPLTKAEMIVAQNGVERVYTTFVQRVADGRNLTTERVDEIGGGRVWSGVSAMELGLIDGFGGINDAIALAADRAGVASDFSVVGAEGKGSMDMIMESLFAQVRTMVMGAQATQLYEKTKAFEQAMKFEGIQALTPMVEMSK